MSRVTVVTDARGEIIAIGDGFLSEESIKGSKSAGFHGGLRAGPNQNLKELELSNDVTSIKDFDELKKHVRPHLR
jgi:hypothetical protein